MKKIKIIFELIALILLMQSCHGQEKEIDRLEVDKDFTLLTYGMPNFERTNLENIIAKQWGIKFYSVAGCRVSKELIDSVETENERVNKNIEKKYGKNWKDKFEKEIDAEFEREKIITAILEKIDFIKIKDDQMNLEGNGLNYIITPIENSTDYNVSVEGWGTIDKKDTWVSYYRMNVNYKSKKYKLLDDKKEIAIRK